jgi:cell division protein FtsB
LSVKQNQKKKHKPSSDSSRTSTHKIISDRRKPDNIRVLRPQSKPRAKTQTKISYGRIAMSGFVILFALWAIKPLFYRIEQKQEQTKFEKQLTQIKQKNNQLREQIDYLKSNDYVEQKARSLGLSKPDEEVIVVVPKNEKETLKVKEKRVDKNDEKEVSNSLWKRIIDTISNVF